MSVHLVRMFSAKYNFFLDSIICVEIKKRFYFSSSVFTNFRKKKLVNLDYAERLHKLKHVNKSGTENEVQRNYKKEESFLDRNNIKKSYFIKKEKGQVEDNVIVPYERKVMITALCKELNKNVELKQYTLYEKNIKNGLDIAENAIAISQLINNISKNKMLYHGKNIRDIYMQLIDKCIPIFDNIPIRSISLILNSMIKTNVFHEDFVFHFLKNRKRIIKEANHVDISILYHFCVNVKDHYSHIRISDDPCYILLDLLNRIYQEAPAYDLEGVASILRCNKKVLKKKSVYWETNENLWNEINKMITNINVFLKKNFFLQISQGSVSQLCNVLGDLEFFDMVDENAYYEILQILRNRNQTSFFTNLDFLNILHVIKYRNVKYNQLLPSYYFSFLFDILKDRSFQQWGGNDLSEVIKVLYYFKRAYHLHLDMASLEELLNEKDLKEIRSLSTMIYILHDICVSTKKKISSISLCEKLYYELLFRLGIKKNSNMELQPCTMKDPVDLDVHEALLLVHSVQIMLTERILHYKCIQDSFFLLSVFPSDTGKWKHFLLHQFFLFGSIQCTNISIFLYFLTQSLVISLQFCISDMVFFLKSLAECRHLIHSSTHSLFETCLDYISAWLVSYPMLPKGNETLKYKKYKQKLEMYSSKITDVHLKNVKTIEQAYKNVLQLVEELHKILHEVTYTITDMNKQKKNQLNEFSHLGSNFTNINGLQCSEILYYFKKLRYINEEVHNILFKNIYTKMDLLTTENIIKIVQGMSIITKGNSINYISVLKKLVNQFIFKHKELKNSKIQVEEMVKMIYLISKLHILQTSKNEILRKYLLIPLEQIDSKICLTLQQIHLLLLAFSNLYPFRYKNLLFRTVQSIFQVHITDTNSVHLGTRDEPNENMHETSPSPISFLQIYFSIIPRLIFPKTNMYTYMNEIYIKTSEVLFKKLYEKCSEEKGLMKETIPFIIDFFNWSFHYMTSFEIHRQFIPFIFNNKDILSKEQYCVFLLTLKCFESKWFLSSDNNPLFISNQSLLEQIDSQLIEILRNKNLTGLEIQIDLRKQVTSLHEEVERTDSPRNPNSFPFKVHDFSFDKKKLAFFDTEEDDEHDVVSREYNSCIDLQSMYKSSQSKEQLKKKEARTDKDHKKRNNKVQKEFEIILRKYAYCQNNENDRIEISQNKKLASFPINYIDEKKKIIFEFLEKQEYYIEVDNSTIEILPSVYIRLFFINHFNFKIIIIPFYEWNHNHGRIEKAKLIYQKLMQLFHKESSSSSSSSVLQEFIKSPLYSCIGEYQ